MVRPIEDEEGGGGGEKSDREGKRSFYAFL